MLQKYTVVRLGGDTLQMCKKDIFILISLDCDNVVIIYIQVEHANVYGQPEDTSSP
jgi:hypothetical protein